MTASGNIFANAFDQAFSGAINWASDSIKIALLDAAYTPNLATHKFFGDVNAHEITGTGYVAGGTALATKTHTVTAANSWGTAWAALTAYTAGQIVRPAAGNGFLYLCVVGGTSAAGAPAFPTVQGQTVVDGTVTWCCVGESITQWSSASPSWATATLSANFAAIYDAQSGVAATEPLIALVTFGGAVVSTAGTYQVTVPTLGWFWNTPA